MVGVFVCHVFSNWPSNADTVVLMVGVFVCHVFLNWPNHADNSDGGGISRFCIF
jgi:hypothetical protein